MAVALDDSLSLLPVFDSRMGGGGMFLPVAAGIRTRAQVASSPLSADGMVLVRRVPHTDERHHLYQRPGNGRSLCLPFVPGPVHRDLLGAGGLGPRAASFSCLAGRSQLCGVAGAGSPLPSPAYVLEQ